MEKKDDVHQPASKCGMFHTSSYYLRKGGYATASIYLFIPPSICLLGRGRRLCGCFFKYSYDWAGKALIASFLTSVLPMSSFPSCFILTCSILAGQKCLPQKQEEASHCIHQCMYLHREHTSCALRDVNYWFAVSLDNQQSLLSMRIDSDSFLGRAGCAAAPSLHPGPQRSLLYALHY